MIRRTTLDATALLGSVLAYRAYIASCRPQAPGQASSWVTAPADSAGPLARWASERGSSAIPNQRIQEAQEGDQLTERRAQQRQEPDATGARVIDADHEVL